MIEPPFTIHHAILMGPGRFPGEHVALGTTVCGIPLPAAASITPTCLWCKQLASFAGHVL